MAKAIPKDILEMTPRERWNWVHRCLAVQRTVEGYRRWVVQCMYSLDFDCVYWVIDEYGMRFDVYGERFLYAKHRRTDKYGYIISRFGVDRVVDRED